MKKASYIFFLFCLLTAQAPLFGQSIQDKLTGHKWALTSYVEVVGMEIDTLFKAFDCQNEYIRFYADNSFEDTNLKNRQDWTVSEKDSIVIFKNSLGIVKKKSRISKLDENTLVLVDLNKGKGVFYIENYTKCTGSETTTLDTRELVTVTKQTNLSFGLQMNQSLMVNAGISLLKTDWKKYKTYQNIELQVNPTDEYYGISGNWLAQNVLLYGGGLSAHYAETDNENICYQFSFQGVFGVTGKPFGGFGENIQLHYTLMIPFIGDRIDVISPHNVVLRVNFPIQSNSKEIRRIER